MSDIYSTDENIKFTNPIQDGKCHYQDIELNGDCIGCIIEITQGWMEPIRTIFQRNIPIGQHPNYPNVEENESIGCTFIQFDTLHGLINFYNLKRRF